MQLILDSIKSCRRQVIAFWCCFHNIFRKLQSAHILIHMDIMNAKNKKSKTNEKNINLVFYSLYDLLFSFPQVSFWVKTYF